MLDSAEVRAQYSHENFDLQQLQTQGSEYEPAKLFAAGVQSVDVLLGCTDQGRRLRRARGDTGLSVGGGGGGASARTPRSPYGGPPSPKTPGRRRRTTALSSMTAAGGLGEEEASLANGSELGGRVPGSPPPALSPVTAEGKGPPRQQQRGARPKLVAVAAAEPTPGTLPGPRRGELSSGATAALQRSQRKALETMDVSVASWKNKSMISVNQKVPPLSIEFPLTSKPPEETEIQADGTSIEAGNIYSPDQATDAIHNKGSGYEHGESVLSTHEQHGTSQPAEASMSMGSLWHSQHHVKEEAGNEERNSRSGGLIAEGPSMISWKSSTVVIDAQDTQQDKYKDFPVVMPAKPDIPTTKDTTAVLDLDHLPGNKKQTRQTRLIRIPSSRSPGGWPKSGVGTAASSYRASEASSPTTHPEGDGRRRAEESGRTAAAATDESGQRPAAQLGHCGTPVKNDGVGKGAASDGEIRPFKQSLFSLNTHGGGLTMAGHSTIPDFTMTGHSTIPDLNTPTAPRNSTDSMPNNSAAPNTSQREALPSGFFPRPQSPGGSVLRVTFPGALETVEEPASTKDAEYSGFVLDQLDGEEDKTSKQMKKRQKPRVLMAHPYNSVPAPFHQHSIEQPVTISSFPALCYNNDVYSRAVDTEIFDPKTGETRRIRQMKMVGMCRTKVVRRPPPPDARRPKSAGASGGGGGRGGRRRGGGGGGGGGGRPASGPGRGWRRPSSAAALNPLWREKLAVERRLRSKMAALALDGVGPGEAAAATLGRRGGGGVGHGGRGKEGGGAEGGGGVCAGSSAGKEGSGPARRRPSGKAEGGRPKSAPAADPLGTEEGGAGRGGRPGAAAVEGEGEGPALLPDAQSRARHVTSLTIEVQRGQEVTSFCSGMERKISDGSSLGPSLNIDDPYFRGLGARNREEGANAQRKAQLLTKKMSSAVELSRHNTFVDESFAVEPETKTASQSSSVLRTNDDQQKDLTMLQNKSPSSQGLDRKAETKTTLETHGEQKLESKHSGSLDVISETPADQNGTSFFEKKPNTGDRGALPKSNFTCDTDNEGAMQRPNFARAASAPALGIYVAEDGVGSVSHAPTKGKQLLKIQNKKTKTVLWQSNNAASNGGLQQQTKLNVTSWQKGTVNSSRETDGLGRLSLTGRQSSLDEGAKGVMDQSSSAWDGPGGGGAVRSRAWSHLPEQSLVSLGGLARAALPPAAAAARAPPGPPPPLLLLQQQQQQHRRHHHHQQQQQHQQQGREGRPAAEAAAAAAAVADPKGGRGAARAPGSRLLGVREAAGEAGATTVGSPQRSLLGDTYGTGAWGQITPVVGNREPLELKEGFPTTARTESELKNLGKQPVICQTGKGQNKVQQEEDQSTAISPADTQSLWSPLQAQPFLASSPLLLKTPSTPMRSTLKKKKSSKGPLVSPFDNDGNDSMFGHDNVSLGTLHWKPFLGHNQKDDVSSTLSLRSKQGVNSQKKVMLGTLISNSERKSGNEKNTYLYSFRNGKQQKREEKSLKANRSVMSVDVQSLISDAILPHNSSLISAGSISRHRHHDSVSKLTMDGILKSYISGEEAVEDGSDVDDRHQYNRIIPGSARSRSIALTTYTGREYSIGTNGT